MTTEAGISHGFKDLTESELIHWGRDFAASLRSPAVIALSGELGAGKTTLVRAICAELGVQETVTSPTFSLVHSYKGATTQLYHLDLYRLNSPAELTNIGWDEMIDANAIVLIEWPDRAGNALPASATKLALWHIPGVPGKRRIIW
jgi:tRNA threonylcarbamoyladenosine biosynthesis protein TsaE